jgi:TonB-linked SusC/RagA family outer membrane protein
VKLSNAKVEKLFSEIEKKSDFVILYKKGIVENKTVSVSTKNENIEAVLNRVLPPLGLSYRINGNQIIVIENEAVPAVEEVEQAPTITASGTITDSQGEPLPGVSVVEKGKATNGTMTDIDGRFSLKVSPGATLEVSYVGFVKQEVKVGAVPLSIVLAEQDTTLDDVVVVGYGTQQKVNLTGSVATIGSRELANRPIQNVSSGIQGLMPGVTVMSGEGRPGQDGATIRVRGTGTLNSSNPYILIDGVESGTMNSLDPNDIESISVLKDAASAAIYGSKASNGVILITTKRGKTGKPNITYNGYAGIQNATNMIERMNSAEYAEIYNRVLTDVGKEPRWTGDDIQKFRDGSDPYGHPNTDWYKLAFQTGFQHQHNVSVNGGTETVRYMASAGLLDQKGILPNSDRIQFNARTNLDIKLSNRLNVRMNLAFINNDYKDADASYAGGSSDQVIRQLNLIAPWIPYKTEDGYYGTVSDGNPIAWLDLGQTVNRYNQNFTGFLAADYTIADGLKASLQGSYITNSQHFKNFRKFIQYNPNKASDPNLLDERFYLWNRTNFDALLNYDKIFGLHGVKALAGWHTEKYNYSENSMVRKNFPNNEMTDINAGDASTQTNSGYTRELAMISWFGRVNYDYAGKYLFEANIRADAASRFQKDHRWGYFPSFSVGWRLSEESFMANTKGWLDNLKIRASWGLLGNQDALTDYYPYMNVYSVDGTYPFGGTLNTGYYQGSYKMSTISWEKARTWGLGVDLTLMGKLNLSLDYYDRKTTDIIMDVPVPDEFGLGAYKDNVGSMLNRGVELNIGYNNRWNDWTLSVNGNVAYNKNEILELGGVDMMADPNNGNIQRGIGQAFGSYYMYKADGFFASDADAQAYMDKYSGKEGYPFSNARPFKGGDLIYADTNGDGLMTAADRIFTNSANPKYIFGLIVNGGWKSFDLSLIFSGQAGSARLYSQEVFGDFRGDTSHPATVWRDSWTFNPSDAKMPRVFEATNSNSHPQSVMSTFWLQNTSFVRMKSLQLGYTFPTTSLKSLGLSKLRVFYSAENLLTFDSMPINLDPEATSERASSYPLIQTHSLGVSLTF